MDKAAIEKKRKDGWIEAWFSIEALSLEKETTETALREHVERMAGIKEVLVTSREFKDTVPVDLDDGRKAYSQIVAVTLFVKDVFTLFNIIMVYGPSAIEIMSPPKKELTIEELQQLANTVAAVMHQFAAAGAGGIVVAPGK